MDMMRIDDGYCSQIFGMGLRLGLLMLMMECLSRRLGGEGRNEGANCIVLVFGASIV